MDVQPAYFTSNRVFQIYGADFPIDLSSYTNVNSVGEANHRRIWALISIGRTYRDTGHNPGNMLSTPQLNNTLLAPCHDVCQHCICYEMDLLKPFNQGMLGAVNATGQKFITTYQTPFYHMRLVLLGGWDTNNIEGCKLYGCGGLAFLICARNVQTDEGSALLLGEKNPEIKLIFQCTNVCPSKDIWIRMAMSRKDSL